MAKIFIADDEVEFQQLIKEALESEAHQIDTASRGDLVIDALKKARPDLLIMDVMMPGMDGLSIVKKLSESGDLSKIPIIVMTAGPSFLHLFDVYPQVRATLPKPLDLGELRKTVASILAG